MAYSEPKREVLGEEETPPSPKIRGNGPNEPPFGPTFTASFSVEFARWALNQGDYSNVLDPFSGSGTTSLAGRLEGIDTYAAELNPAWVIYSKARLLSDIESIETALCHVDEAPTLRWPVVKEVLGTAIDTQIHNNMAAIALAAAVLWTVRKGATDQKSTNHSWLKVDNDWEPKVPTDGVRESLSEIREHVNWLEKGIAGNPSSSVIEATDICDVATSAGPFDAVVTSPPYLTRLDYIRATTPEITLLERAGCVQDSKELRRTQIGSVLVSDVDGELPDLPRPVHRFLENVRDHPSKASRTYYYKFYRKYFESFLQAWQSINNKVKIGGIAYLVVQDSWYKDLFVPTGNLLSEIITDAGWEFENAWGFGAKTLMSNIHESKSTWREDNAVNEWVIGFSKVR